MQTLESMHPSHAATNPMLSSQRLAAVPLHLCPVEPALVCSPQKDTDACATLATCWTPADTTALVGWHLLCLLGLDGPFSPSGSCEKVSLQPC